MPRRRHLRLARAPLHQEMPSDLDAKEGVMRSTRARFGLEGLESRALLTATTVGFNDFPVQSVNDKVGTVDVNVGLSGAKRNSAPVTVTLSTSGGSAVPGVDYTPVQQTITLTPGNAPGPAA